MLRCSEVRRVERVNVHETVEKRQNAPLKNRLNFVSVVLVVTMSMALRVRIIVRSLRSILALVECVCVLNETNAGKYGRVVSDFKCQFG